MAPSRHPQDRLIVVQALVHWAGNPNQLTSEREERAWELVEEIADDMGLPASELLRQVDDDWSG
jgi:hypothetical protein